MTVDLNTCLGCNACVVACQAENNVPVVGKEQVRRNRDMAWIRIDRYFAGEPRIPKCSRRPMMCQHCENAPCETVCPVNATVHSDDGLNLMAYNRCIGTRYLLQQLPLEGAPLQLLRLQSATARSPLCGSARQKGHGRQPQNVEKPERYRSHARRDGEVHLCIQRIEEAKIARLVEAGARNKNEVPIREFKTACQQACPSDSLVFRQYQRSAEPCRRDSSERAALTLC